MSSSLERTLKNLPNQPGVYRFYDLQNNLLYVGKAKNLKYRIRSYFQKSSNLIDTRGHRIELMVSQIDRLDYTVVSNEKESLILEANLIHSLQPKYNVLLKDDKSYVYVRVTIRDQIPGIFLVRQKFDPRSVYFGPYTKRAGIQEALRTIRQIFPYCTERFPSDKPCFYTSLHLCEGICAGLETREHYQEKIDQIVKILSGKTVEVENYIKDKVRAAAEVENYALAGLWRDRLLTLTETIIDQKVVLSEPRNIDLVSLVLEQQVEGQVLGSLFYQGIRVGKINNVLNYLLTGTNLKVEASQNETDDPDLDMTIAAPAEVIEEEMRDPDLEIDLSYSDNIISTGGIEMEFLTKFILSFYYQLLDLPETVYFQVFCKSEADVQKRSLQAVEIEAIQNLIPEGVKVKAM